MSAFKAQPFGRYLLLDQINEGGMAEVFRGLSSGAAGFERMVALKRIRPDIASDPDFVEMFVQEAKLAVQFQHANIAQIYDLGEVDGRYFIAMEYVAGVDLRTMWNRARKRRRLLPIAMSCHIIQKCCEGLDAAHRKKNENGDYLGLVHRDVSPQNILISFDGEVKVIDFGIAKVAGQVGKTNAGVLKGKFGYMSPEQVRGLSLDHRADIFACGVILHELLVGRRLFLGESEFATLERIRNLEIRPPSEVNAGLAPALDHIVLKALSRPVDERYKWASQMAEALQHYLFVSQQTFNRSDMQRYMARHFQEEITAEKERIEGYKGLSTTRSMALPDLGLDAGPADPASIEPLAPHDTSSTPARRAPSSQHSNSALSSPNGSSIPSKEPAQSAHRTTQGDPGYPRQPSKPAGQPQHAQHPKPAAVVARISPEGARAPNASSTTPPEEWPRDPALSGAPPSAHVRSVLPTWAAMLIGALIAAIAGGIAFILVGRAPPPGVLTLSISPAESRPRVYLDEQLVSNASPFSTTLEPGTYVVRVSADGYDDVLRAVRVREGEAREETILLPRKRGTATLVVRSDPPGLQVWIDGRYTGEKTPASFSRLDAGPVTVALMTDGGDMVHRFNVTLREHSAELLDVDTKALPPILDVTSSPLGGLVFVDGAVRGTTPVSISGLEVGRRKVEINREGCIPFERSVRLEAGRIEMMNAPLVCRQDSTVDHPKRSPP